MHVTVFWKVLVDRGVLPCCFKYLLNAKVLILWAVEYFDVVTFDARKRVIERKLTYYFLFPETRSLRK